MGDSEAMNSQNMITDQIARLQHWYHAQCNGDWEHQFGIRICTLDNPGWMVDIDLADTVLVDKQFPAVSFDRNEHDWVRCKIERSIFKGRGGAENLGEILRIFFNWTEQ